VGIMNHQSHRTCRVHKLDQQLIIPTMPTPLLVLVQLRVAFSVQIWSPISVSHLSQILFVFFFRHAKGGEGDIRRVEGIDKRESGLFICTATGVDCRRLEVCSHHARCRQGWKTTPSRNVGLLLFAWSWRLRPIFCGHVLPNCHSHATRQICTAHGQEHEGHCQ
jgi:hypothetical protein